MSRSPSVGKPRSPLETIDGKETTLKLSMPIYGLPSEQKKAILSEAQVMLRTGEVFVIGGDYCSFLGIRSVEFTPNAGEQYHRVMKNGTFMPNKYPTPKQWARKISRTIEDTTVEYIMSHEGPRPTREEALDYQRASYIAAMSSPYARGSSIFDGLRADDKNAS